MDVETIAAGVTGLVAAVGAAAGAWVKVDRALNGGKGDPSLRTLVLDLRKAVERQEVRQLTVVRTVKRNSEKIATHEEDLDKLKACVVRE